MSKRRRNARRQAPLVGRDAKREYWADVAGEPQPASPVVAWTPDPPPWMLQPVTVYDTSGAPVQWLDEYPRNEWAARVGKARFELMKLDAAAEKKKPVPSGGVPPGLPFQPSRRVPLEFLNSKQEQLTVQERERYRVPPWAGRTWVKESLKRKEGRPTVYLPPPEEDEELPQAECVIAPWWAEE
ncbi:hypothetical protein ABT213_29845 [Streptomyces sp. NPDC001674]|uniref:hypothetical protein n=1 Tax=Streptomyces sp. NPDC001674 TaxID=3154394 RepID=UPI0033318EE1